MCVEMGGNIRNVGRGRITAQKKAVTALPRREHNANNPVKTENTVKARAIRKNANMNRVV